MFDAAQAGLMAKQHDEADAHQQSAKHSRIDWIEHADVNKAGMQLRQGGDESDGAECLDREAPAHAPESQIIEWQVDDKKHHPERNCRNVINQKCKARSAAGQ